MNIKLFKKTFKFVCDECGKFGHTQTEYCEVCGSKAMRKAKKEDYLEHEISIKKEGNETKRIASETKKAEKEAKKAEK